MIIEKQGYNFEFDDPPPLKTIHGYGKSIGDQYWKRDEWYNYTDEQYSHLSYETQTEIAEIEDMRCREGVWMMLKGEPFWIPPDAYFWLTHWTIDNRHTDFIMNQMWDFYFYRHCELDNNCFGSLEFKPRREGCTSRKLNCMMNKARGIYDKWFGILSKTGDDARDVNFAGCVKGYARLPYWMKPEVSGNFPPKTVLEFAQPAQRANKKNNRDIQSLGKDSLNTKIDWGFTSEIAYDGAKLYRLLIDEVAKFKEANAVKLWNTHKLCLVDGYDIFGKAYLLSTIEGDEDKESSKESIDNFITLWKGSDHNELDMLNRTQTGLYRWFIPFQLSVRGNSPRTKQPLVDKYGTVDEIEALLLRKSEIDTAKTPRAKLVIKRQKPTSVQEAMVTMGASSTFANIQERLQERLNYLDNFTGTPERPVKWRKGNLHWQNNIRFGKVVFRDDEENGRFKIAYFPEIAGENMGNRYKTIGDRLFAPYSNSPFKVGFDPIQFENVQYGEGSKPAFHIKLNYNISNPKMSYLYCLQYFARPSIDVMCEDAAKALLLYGAMINLERQSASILFKFLKDNGMRAFLMKRPDAAKWNTRTKKDSDFGTPTSTKSIQIGLGLIENYFALPDPENNENEKDNLNYFWFEETIEQLMNCDPKDMEKYDLASSMCQTEIASQTDKRFQTFQKQEVENLNAMSIADYLAPIHSQGGIITHREYKQQQRNSNYDPIRRAN